MRRGHAAADAKPDSGYAAPNRGYAAANRGYAGAGPEEGRKNDRR